MLKATLKGLLAHKLRMTLTAIAVVLGVGFIAGTYVLTDTINRTFSELFDDVTAGVDVFVRSEQAFRTMEGDDQRQPIPEELLDEIESVDGVAEARGSVVGYAQIVDKEGEAIAPVGPPTLGVSWTASDGEIVVAREGRQPERDGEVAIDAATAEDADFQVGDDVEILLQEGRETFELVGIAGFGEADNLAGATLALFDLETAQRVLDRVGEFDSVEVVAEDGVSAAELASRMGSILPKGIEAATAEAVSNEQAEALQEGLGFLTTALLVFASVALFVGAFIIFNTFSIVVAQRTREFALLRALGASARQILGSVVIEALIVGTLASAVGIGVGLLVALALQQLLGAFGLDLPSTSLQLLPRTLIVSMIVGLVVTVASSLMPARRAARISPMEALREAAPRPYQPSFRRVLGGGGVLGTGIVLLFLGLFTEIGDPLSLVGAGAFSTLLGVALLSPLFAGPLAGAIGVPAETMAAMPGKLARENARRNPRRTAATSAALMIGLALVSFTAILGASLKASATAFIDETLRADFIIANNSLAGARSFSPSIATRLEEVDGLASVSPLRFGEWRLKQQTRFLSAVDPSTFSTVTDIGSDAAEASLLSLPDDGVMVHRDLARDLDLTPGDDLKMRFASTGAQIFEVHGTYANKEIASEFIITLAAHEANYPLILDDMVLLKVDEGQDVETVRLAVDEAVRDFPSVEVQDQTEFKERTEEQVDQLLGLIQALLALAVVIAALGIANTLALSVFERTREIGLLRAVGMQRRQARSMIRWEAVIISLIGAVLGLAVGALFGWALVRALADEGIKKLRVPGLQLVILVALAALLGVLAAIGPARRAAKLKVLEAIATE